MIVTSALAASTPLTIAPISRVHPAEVDARLCTPPPASAADRGGVAGGFSAVARCASLPTRQGRPASPALPQPSIPSRVAVTGTWHPFNAARDN